MTAAHISDVHFGRIAHKDIVDRMVADINEHEPAVVVVSGDLTQRARRHQFRDAAAMLEGFDAPLVVVPGNHDVAAWYRPFHRLGRPLSRYRRFITRDLTPTFENEAMAVFGLNSAYGLTVKGGRIRSGQIEAMRSFFGHVPDTKFKIVAVHHHLTPISVLGRHDVARNGPKALQAAAECGVELILCGHLHQSHIETVRLEKEGHQVIIASAGTATSTRGRRDDRLLNYYNYIMVEPDGITIEERRFDIDGRLFEIIRTSRFPRTV